MLIFIGIAVILLRIPVLGKYLAVINTLIHEIGHALMALVTGGRVEKIKLFANTEGVASTRNHWLGGLFTSAAGYPFASAMAWLFLYLIYIENYTAVLIILAGVLVISFLLWIRNVYGFLWVLTFGALFAWMFWLDNTILTENVLLFITAVVFVKSITSAFTIMTMSFKTPRDAGDATSLARATFIIPAQLWGILFFAQSLAVAWFGIRLYI
ncbi:M50 family metallopeptidase [Evansella clarkii]|uniref:M50 family metallopeptidase n=1 Tax=Evansella clarkii TaxID=79879 RepID=UPI001FD2B0B8|nr:M50 family metallopeptidase [Evansella clarkii]